MELVTIQPQPLCVRRSDLQYPLNGSLGGSLRQFGSFEGQKNISFKCYNVLCNISLKEQLPEDAQSRWPKHVVGYVAHNIVNLHIIIALVRYVLQQKNICTVRDLKPESFSSYLSYFCSNYNTSLCSYSINQIKRSLWSKGVLFVFTNTLSLLTFNVLQN